MSSALQLSSSAATQLLTKLALGRDCRLAHVSTHANIRHPSCTACSIPEQCSACRTWYSDQVGAESIDDFWVDPEAIQLYKDHAQFILQRKNTVNGLTYGNDPTFFAWNL